MSEQRPRPRAFRLDDSKVVLDGAPLRAATTVMIESDAAAIPHFLDHVWAFDLR